MQGWEQKKGICTYIFVNIYSIYEHELNGKYIKYL